MTCDSFLRDFSLSFWGKTLSNCWEKGKKREVFDVLKKITQRANLRWCLFFWLFTENHLVLEFRLFVFLLFHDLL